MNQQPVDVPSWRTVGPRPNPNSSNQQQHLQGRSVLEDVQSYMRSGDANPNLSQRSQNTTKWSSSSSSGNFYKPIPIYEQQITKFLDCQACSTKNPIKSNDEIQNHVRNEYHMANCTRKNLPINCFTISGINSSMFSSDNSNTLFNQQPHFQEHYNSSHTSTPVDALANRLQSVLGPNSGISSGPSNFFQDQLNRVPQQNSPASFSQQPSYSRPGHDYSPPLQQFQAYMQRLAQQQRKEHQPPKNYPSSVPLIHNQNMPRFGPSSTPPFGALPAPLPIFNASGPNPSSPGFSLALGPSTNSPSNSPQFLSLTSPQQSVDNSNSLQKNLQPSQSLSSTQQTLPSSTSQQVLPLSSMDEFPPLGAPSIDLNSHKISTQSQPDSLNVVQSSLFTNKPRKKDRERVASREALSKLQEELPVAILSLKPPENSKSMRLDAKERIQNVCRKIFLNAKVHLIGSTKNGLYSVDSDLDLCLELPDSDILLVIDSSGNQFQWEEEEEDKEYQIEEKKTDDENNEDDKKKERKPIDPVTRLRSCVVSQLEPLFDSSDNHQLILALPKARMPIIKVYDTISNLTCDVGINNMLGIYNSELVRDYLSLDPRAMQLAFSVKRWAKVRDVNDPYHCTLSSYAYLLMVINFLQMRSPPILPCLQALVRDQDPKQSAEGRDCSYFKDFDYLKKNGYGPTSRNSENIAQLLTLFFGFFAHDFDYRSSVVSVRCGRLITRSEKDWERSKGRDRHWISIEDPFELDHDLGNVVLHETLYFIRGEFMRAHRLLCDSGSFDQLCDPPLLSEEREGNPKERKKDFQKRSSPKPRVYLSKEQNS